MMFLISFLWASAGMGTLCLAMDRHAKQAGYFPAKAGAGGMRLFGTMCLAGALYLTITDLGIGMGTALWGCQVSLAGWLIAIILPYRAKWVPGIVAGSAIVAMAGILIYIVAGWAPQIG
ncbi:MULTISPECIES: DUF3325 domain-containing protein [Thalassospira]|jgi:hypothetical protein|uniref:DUF3325 domain-containing protein n=1 Tax=Thalassospira TaxID=168934 RepID=UPI001FFFB61A|nr:DUF3325 domain-containing protein [Thalassospira xiamenensis]MCK2167032.1 DUF3325 domain-containing protein [Thalassospira xiamenensis]